MKDILKMLLTVWKIAKFHSKDFPSKISWNQLFSLFTNTSYWFHKNFSCESESLLFPNCDKDIWQNNLNLKKMNDLVFVECDNSKYLLFKIFFFFWKVSWPWKFVGTCSLGNFRWKFVIWSQWAAYTVLAN